MPSTHHLPEPACILIVGPIIAPVHRSLSVCDNGLHGSAAERPPASVGHSADPRISPAITHGPRCIAWYMSGNPSRIPVFLRDPDPRRQRGRDHSTSGGTTTGNSRPLQCPNGREPPRTGGSHIRAMDYFSPVAPTGHWVRVPEPRLSLHERDPHEAFRAIRTRRCRTVVLAAIMSAVLAASAGPAAARIPPEAPRHR